MKKDKIFSRLKQKKDEFKFDKDTADVFDDMLNRSVPFYDEIQRMIVEITRQFVQKKSNVYDLGCSTGMTIAKLLKEIKTKNTRFYGIDNSSAMISKAKRKLNKVNSCNKFRLKVCDLNDGLKFSNASVIIMNLTLQFVRPLNRDSLIKDIYKGLREKGCFILVEKVLGENSIFNRTFIDLYYDFKKRRGYSELEIAQKREALESVLIPYRVNENIEVLRRNGFKYIDIFFKWYNFCGFLAVKLRSK